MRDSFEDMLTSLLVAIHANHSVQQVSDKGQTTHDICGLTSGLSSEIANQNTVSLKTSKGTYRLDSPQSSPTWKKMVTEQRGEYSQRKNAAHRTEGNGCSSWPTAAARDFKGCGNAVDRKDGKHRLDTLEAVVKFGLHAPDNPNTNGKPQESWATPNTMDMLPPKTGEALARNKKKGGCRNLREDVNKPPTTGKLNPRWVESLMGVPIGWTMPSCVTIELMNCDYLETE
jgi:hypothetical protein